MFRPMPMERGLSNPWFDDTFFNHPLMDADDLIHPSALFAIGDGNLSRHWLKKVDLHGMQPNEVHVKIDKNLAQITGSRQIEDEGSLQFNRNVPIPDDVDPQSVKSCFVNDYLVLRGQRRSADDSKTFTAQFECHGMKPDEVKVNVSKDGQLTVEGTKRVQHGGVCMERHFREQVALPSDVDVKQIKSELHNGRLTVTAPKLLPAVEAGEATSSATSSTATVSKQPQPVDITIEDA